ncbi:hypothetical protein ACFLVK_00045 [Chloroflexota bacterium]
MQILSPSKDLTIVDPYFFPANLPDRAGYLGTFREIFGLVIPKVAMVRFITKPDHDRALHKDIKSVLTNLNPEINVVHKMTNDFHDRFWIADEVKGLFIGTSLNGIGRNAKRFQVGDEVFGDVADCGRGGLAEYVCAREDVLALKPASMTFEEVVTVPFGAGTACRAFAKHRFNPDKRS